MARIGRGQPRIRFPYPTTSARGLLAHVGTGRIEREGLAQFGAAETISGQRGDDSAPVPMPCYRHIEGGP